MRREQKTARRRAKARRLHADGLGVREIARMLRCDPSTISRDLKAKPPERALAPPPEANTRALKHGAFSERRLAPLREAHAKLLRADYELDGRRVALLSGLLAQIEAAADWLDRQESIVRDDETGDVWGVVDRLAKWTTQAWGMLRELEEIAKAKQSPGAALAEHLAKTYGDEERAA